MLFRASLQASALILQHNLSSFQNLLTEHSDLFSRLVLHPSTNYPGRTQEHVLGSLLRKKLEPAVEELVEAAREAARSAGVDPSRMMGKKPSEDEDEEDDEDEEGYRPEDEDDGGDPLANLWEDAWTIMNEKLKEFSTREARHLFTAKEREGGAEKVRTGLRRDLAGMDFEDDEEEEEDGEGDEDEEEGEKDGEDVLMGGQDVVQQPVEEQGPPKRIIPVEELLWFMTSGQVHIPRWLQMERADSEERRRKGQHTAHRGGYGR
jgi:mediator of RNA polymerase II transcription subunit 8